MPCPSNYEVKEGICTLGLFWNQREESHFDCAPFDFEVVFDITRNLFCVLVVWSDSTARYNNAIYKKHRKPINVCLSKCG